MGNRAGSSDDFAAPGAGSGEPSSRGTYFQRNDASIADQLRPIAAKDRSDDRGKLSETPEQIDTESGMGPVLPGNESVHARLTGGWRGWTGSGKRR